MTLWAGTRRNLRKRRLGSEGQISGRLWTGEIQGEILGNGFFLPGKILEYLCLLSGTVTLTPLALPKKDLVLGLRPQQTLPNGL